MDKANDNLSGSNIRNSLRVTWSVWHALFMREAVARTMADRMAWFWMLFEPIAIVLIMVSIRGLVASGQHVAGADYIPWLVTGLMGFYLVRENMMRLLGAVDANKALFTYRQVKPVDPVLTRGYLEFILRSFIFLAFILIGNLLGIQLFPDNPLEVFYVWMSLWCLGLSAGVLFSSVSVLIPEVGKIIKIMSLPLLIISGVIFPVTYIPHEFHDYILYNPIVHGLESLRVSFFNEYNTLNDINMIYMWAWTLIMMSLGLLLHIRFQSRLKSL